MHTNQLAYNIIGSEINYIAKTEEKMWNETEKGILLIATLLSQLI